MAVRWDLLRAKQRDWNKEELLDVIYWLRVLAALACGLLCGAVGLTGAYGFVIFAVVAVIGPQALIRRQKADVTICEPQELLMEGLGPGLCTFMGLWILLFSTFHA